MKRREFLRAGLTGFAALSLPELFRLRAEARLASQPERTALIVVWLHGGASHLETYDPKPLASSEYRGPYQPIATRVPGLQFCELLPRQAAIADRFAVLRSLVHTGFCHDDGPQQIFTGHAIQGRRLRPDNPDLFTIANYLRSDASRTVPNYVGVGPIPYLGSAYLGPAYEAFAVHGDPNNPKFSVPNIGLTDPAQAAQLASRISLRKQFDRLRRDVDQSGNMEAMDRFEVQAWNLLTGPDAQRAFDLNLEAEATRDRYGRNAWGQQCLMARRLVEAGVELVTVTLNGPLCGRVGNWDDHAVNHHVFDAMKYRAPFLDQAIEALTCEIYERGLDKRVMLIVGGDFGRTPRISYVASSGGGVASAPAGVVQPGRDHWPNAMSFLFSGGGVPTGQIIGATDRRGEEVIDRRLHIGDFVATVYRHLGIQPDKVAIPDFAGRPIPILQDGKPIPELLS
jgi:uncharacterized protein (DUF1501 family)